MSGYAKRPRPSPDDIQRQLTDPALIALKIEIRTLREQLSQQGALKSQCQDLRLQVGELRGELQQARLGLEKYRYEQRLSCERERQYRTTVRLSEGLSARQGRDIFISLVNLARARDGLLGTDYAEQITQNAQTQGPGVSALLAGVQRAVALLVQQDGIIIQRLRDAGDVR